MERPQVPAWWVGSPAGSRCDLRARIFLARHVSRCRAAPVTGNVPHRAKAGKPEYDHQRNAIVSDKSKIEGTDATWNPVRGCQKISPGCKHCYAQTFAERLREVPKH